MSKPGVTHRRLCSQRGPCSETSIEARTCGCSRLPPFLPHAKTTSAYGSNDRRERAWRRHPQAGTQELYSYQLRRWFEWCETNGLDPLTGIQRAHVELYIRNLGEAGLMASSINTMMHGLRGYFRYAHIDGLIPSDPAVYARLPRIHTDESRTQGLDRLEFDPVPSGRPVHHGPPRCPGLSVGHQRSACLRGGSGPDRGLRRDTAGPKGAAPGRQG